MSLVSCFIAQNMSLIESRQTSKQNQSDHSIHTYFALYKTSRPWSLVNQQALGYLEPQQRCNFFAQYFNSSKLVISTQYKIGKFEMLLLATKCPFVVLRSTHQAYSSVAFHNLLKGLFCCVMVLHGLSPSVSRAKGLF